VRALLALPTQRGHPGARHPRVSVEGSRDEPPGYQYLAKVARTLTDANRATVLVGDAESCVCQLEPDARKAAALADIARTLSTSDPGRTASLIDEVDVIVGSLADTSPSHFLLRIIRTTADFDPDRAAGMLETICRVALSQGSGMTAQVSRAQTLQIIAELCIKAASSGVRGSA
jgi:hypothetical protein